MRIDRGLFGLAMQVFVDFIKQCECKQHHRSAEKHPGLLPGVRLVECFDMDPGICPVLPVHSATLPPLSMATVRADGIQGALACSPLDASALKSGNRSSAVGGGRSSCARIHGTGQQSERFRGLRFLLLRCVLVD